MNFEQRWEQIKNFITTNKASIGFEGDEIDYDRDSEPFGNMAIYIRQTVADHDLIPENMASLNIANCIIGIIATNQSSYFECSSLVQKLAIKLRKLLHQNSNTLAIKSRIRIIEPDEMFTDKAVIMIHFLTFFEDYT